MVLHFMCGQSASIEVYQHLQKNFGLVTALLNEVVPAESAHHAGSSHITALGHRYQECMQVRQPLIYEHGIQAELRPRVVQHFRLKHGCRNDSARCEVCRMDGCDSTGSAGEYKDLRIVVGYVLSRASSFSCRWFLSCSIIPLLRWVSSRAYLLLEKKAVIANLMPTICGCCCSFRSGLCPMDTLPPLLDRPWVCAEYHRRSSTVVLIDAEQDNRLSSHTSLLRLVRMAHSSLLQRMGYSRPVESSGHSHCLSSRISGDVRLASAS